MFSVFWKQLLLDINSFSDIAEWWDERAKPEIRNFCVMFSVERKKLRSQKKLFLLSYLKIVIDNKNWEEIIRVREQLDIMLKEDAWGFVVRSRFQQNAEAERASLFHAGKERKNTKNFISCLKRQDEVITDQADIENEVVSFFRALFNGHHDDTLTDRGSPFVPDNTNLDEMLHGISCMDKPDKDKLEVDICAEELEFVVGKCAKNKAPGLDGICYEFYQHTWHIIKGTFLSVLQCQLDRHKLIKSDTKGVTRLLSKVDGIPKVDELRPITLLNSDYKILAKVLVLRMKPVMPQIINSGQLCSVGKKNILFGVFNALSSFAYVNQKKRGACILSLDLFKAYDRVFLPFLVSVMRKMGFGNTFCSWIKMLHLDASTRFILVKLSREISVSFSIRQGDPLAMLLFIIYIEPLLIYIEKRAKGLTLLHPLASPSGNEVVQCVEAYCDDLNVITDNDNDLLLVDCAVRKFEALSGAILSRNKLELS